MHGRLGTHCAVSISGSGSGWEHSGKARSYQHFHTVACHLPQLTPVKQPEPRVSRCETDLLTHVRLIKGCTDQIC